MCIMLFNQVFESTLGVKGTSEFVQTEKRVGAIPRLATVQKCIPSGSGVWVRGPQLLLVL